LILSHTRVLDKILRVSNNHFEALPDSLGQLELVELLVNGNRLTVFPGSSGLVGKAWKNYLKTLDLRDNALLSFPTGIRSLKQLEVLQMKRNRFTLEGSARLALELPKLRVFSAPGEVDGDDTSAVR